ncbi:DUF5667 domain-containing protein [Blastococcus brunescens]|uniref:DUF5667 domain-containing protein n=1 Tax=Blastococcus brunescens TaxID=1564165 RepID=A0ABZ1AX79_9ACTN|nr:DUF5667 domain-containing protein [Blastococcus sp. BMG 8361]WRL63177.1 DUF5667 domain-containing protein [Blastococcus sp. BMG 8361]
MAVTALAGLVAVADGARPGDVLYDLKRGTEQTQLALAGDSRGRTLLDFASTRLDEVAALVGEGGTALPATPAGDDGATVSAAAGDASLVVETLQTMDEQTTDGAAWLTDRAVETGGTGPLEDLARWTTGQAGELADLQSRMPAEASDAAAQSLTLLAGISARTAGLQAALACPGGPAVAGTDALGPVPAPAPPPCPFLRPHRTAAPPTRKPVVRPRDHPAGDHPGAADGARAPVPGSGGGAPTPTAPTQTSPRLPAPSLPLPRCRCPAAVAVAPRPHPRRSSSSRRWARSRCARPAGDHRLLTPGLLPFRSR